MSPGPKTAGFAANSLCQSAMSAVPQAFGRDGTTLAESVTSHRNGANSNNEFRRARRAALNDVYTRLLKEKG